MEMRNVLCQELENLMNQDDKIIIIDADLSKANGTFSLREKFPTRALDVGIAEQNMASIAAGLASYGFKPIILSFTPFATRRICDQIAVSIAYAKQNVKIIGTDPGLAAELNGGTHMSVEDIGVLRSIPSVVIFEPVDNTQLKQALPKVINYNGPVYTRMFRKETPDIFDKINNYKFDLFKGDLIQEGSDVTIIASGILVSEALKASEILSQKNIKPEIINIHTIKPIDEEIIIKSAQKTRKVITCENHNILGGLGSAVCEVLSKNLPTPVETIGIKDIFGEVGKLQELKNKFEMTADDIVKAYYKLKTKFN
ncbi:MAG: transketolase family protein [Oscillospiraceae bacterium]|nr:transketolase family protein [Oscillospiraceae bacterium]